MIRNKHQDLFLPFWKSCIRNLKEYAFDRSRWWLILIGVATVFILAGLIKIDFLNVLDISLDTAKVIVDQRTANIAIITSITLVVVGFLINNLAVKEAFAYRLLFKHSYLYPIIYLTISTIGCFFIVSTLRDELEPTHFIRMVIAGTYLALIILFLIGFLFKTIIQFTNDKVIRRLLHDELMIEANQNLKRILLLKYSGEEYKDDMKSLGAKEYDWAEALDFADNNLEVKETSEKEIAKMNAKERRVHDINMSKLKKIMLKKKKHPERIYYQDLALEKIISEHNNYLWQKDRPNTDKEKFILRKSIVLKKLNDTKKDKESVRKYFDQKFEELVNSSEHRNLKELLKSYYELYELQMKHQ